MAISLPLALAAGGATLIQAVTSFALSQVVSVAAQRAITDMRRSVQAHVLKLPVGYFDGTKTGALISRIMSDAEGIRNLVGTGLIQLTGGLLTAMIALSPDSRSVKRWTPSWLSKSGKPQSVVTGLIRLEKWGDRRGLNPQPLVPQTSALTN